MPVVPNGKHILMRLADDNGNRGPGLYICASLTQCVCARRGTGGILLCPSPRLPEALVHVSAIEGTGIAELGVAVQGLLQRSHLRDMYISMQVQADDAAVPATCSHGEPGLRLEITLDNNVWYFACAPAWHAGPTESRAAPVLACRAIGDMHN